MNRLKGRLASVSVRARDRVSGALRLCELGQRDLRVSRTGFDGGHRDLEITAPIRTHESEHCEPSSLIRMFWRAVRRGEYRSRWRALSAGLP